MIKGVIYKYTSPDNGVYIGQTINECHRRGLFFLVKHYGGYKIDKARKEFGPENFKYERLFIKEYINKKEAKLELDKIEAYYIGLHNSIENGLNSYRGVNLEIVSSPNPEKIYKNNAGIPLKYPYNYESKNYKFKKVDQYDLQENLIASYASICEASRETEIHISNISRCCQGKLKRARHFIFKFNNN